MLSSRHRHTSLFLLFIALGCEPDPGCVAENKARDADAGTLAWPAYCYRSCTRDDECSSAWEICNRGRCRISPQRTFCVSNDVSSNARGDREDCGAYICDQPTGLCKRRCQSTDHCSGTYVCDTSNGTCVAGQGAGGGSKSFTKTTPIHDKAGCVRACTQASDCEDNEICYSGECLLRSNYCDGSTLTDGTEFRVDCAPYACNPVDGRCFSDCNETAECAGGNACCGPPTHRCGASVDSCY